MLKPGQEAPDFSLPNQKGETVTLSQYRNKKNVVIFFYPKDNTPGCTAQSCSFRDNYLGFSSLDTEVIGISEDSVDSHIEFSDQYKLKYPILSDEKGLVRKKFGLKKLLGILPPRTSFAIDKKGVIQQVYSSQLKSTQHIDEMLRACQTMAKVQM